MKDQAPREGTLFVTIRSFHDDGADWDDNVWLLRVAFSDSRGSTIYEPRSIPRAIANLSSST
jgi:hypothetical protein